MTIDFLFEKAGGPDGGAALLNHPEGEWTRTIAKVAQMSKQSRCRTRSLNLSSWDGLAGSLNLGFFQPQGRARKKIGLYKTERQGHANIQK